MIINKKSNYNKYYSNYYNYYLNEGLLDVFKNNSNINTANKLALANNIKNKINENKLFERYIRNKVKQLLKIS
jgi:hypothetical protein